MSRQNQPSEGDAEAAAAARSESGTRRADEPASGRTRSAGTPTRAAAGGTEPRPASAQASGTPEPGPTATAGEPAAPPSAPAATGGPGVPASASARADGASAAPAAEPSAPAGSATSPAAARATEEPEAIAVAAAAPPSVTAGTGTDSSRPRKPVLAGAAFLGAALVAIPLLLAGSARDDGPRDDAGSTAAAGSDTVLSPDSAPAELGDYVAGKPSASPSKKKPEKPAAPKTVAPPPAAPEPEPEPEPSRTAVKKAPVRPKPEPKPSPRPDWSTETVYATSVLEVNQAWTTNRIRMVMQTDGNLVVYNEHGKATWASMTFGENHRAIFQTDGNLVIHNGDDRPIWASRTHGNEGAQLVLRADGKVVVLHHGRVIWST
ncbi:mannose-binding protein [Streptomyces albogriseolus]|uniref:mannose-binding protein n=1 Tax=Streptomyces albogriseolus TaxID=1887 RepID=UPI0036F74A1A